MKSSVMHIREVLDKFKSEKTPNTRIAVIQRVWLGVVGSAIAERCWPVSENKGTVRIGCSSSVWAQELDLMSIDVVDKLNKQIGDGLVRAIKCEAYANKSRLSA